MDEAETLTVTTTDMAYQYKADGWMVADNGQLDVTAGEEKIVASFAPGAWMGIHLDSDHIPDTEHVPVVDKSVST